MSKRNCSACQDLQDYAPEFATNGVTTTVANSLKNNTGFNSSLKVRHEDCEDLNDANDCLIGNMEDEIEAYEVCDWKDYMKKLVGNLYEVLKAIIAAICGLWTRAERLCELNDMVVNMIAPALTSIPADSVTNKITFALPPEFKYDISEAETCSGGKVGYLSWTWYVPGNVTTVTQQLERGDILATWNRSTIEDQIGTRAYERLNAGGHYSSIAFWILGSTSTSDSTIVGAMFMIYDDHCQLMVESLNGHVENGHVNTVGDTVTFHPSLQYRKLY